jgi:hypothetical protein
MGSPEQSGEWETQAEIDACLEETGVTGPQIRRWRRKGLLPEVQQIPDAYHGSVVLYPRGTCAQIKAAKALFGEKNRVDYVGLRLWRQGFPVDEKYWRPRLRRLGSSADRILTLLHWLQSRYDDDQSPNLPERAAQRRMSNIILSRIVGRLTLDDLAIFFRVLLNIGMGQFDGFESPVKGEGPTRDKLATIKAFDMEAAERHEVLGQKLDLIRVLPSALENASIAFSMGSFAQAADAPADEIFQARDDARNSLTIILSLYKTMSRIYGDQAFGLRFFAWFAERAPDATIDGLILPMMRLRAIPRAVMSSEKIAELAFQAEAVLATSERIERLRQEDPR